MEKNFIYTFCLVPPVLVESENPQRQEMETVVDVWISFSRLHWGMMEFRIVPFAETNVRWQKKGRITPLSGGV